MMNFKKTIWIALIGCLSFTFTTVAEEPFRPVEGEFPPIEKAHSYRGELIFVDSITCFAKEQKVKCQE